MMNKKNCTGDNVKIDNIKIDGINLEYCYIPPKGKTDSVCLAIHGNGGGWDQGVNLVKPNLPNDWGILSISRFGYLNSEIPNDSSPTNQARFIKKLLEYLQIKEVVLFYSSAGSFTGIRFALLYPDFVHSIISLSGVAFSPDMEYQKTPPSFILNGFFFSMFKSIFPGFFRSMFGITKLEWNNANIESKLEYNKIIKGIFPVGSRRDGMLNDNRYIVNDAYKNYNSYCVEDIECPFLILHSETDPWNPGCKIREMANRIKMCHLSVFERGGHVLLGYGSQIKESVWKFIMDKP